MLDLRAAEIGSHTILVNGEARIETVCLLLHDCGLIQTDH